MYMTGSRIDYFNEQQESKYYGPISTMRTRQQPHPGQSINDLSNDNISLSFHKISSQDAQSSQNVLNGQLNNQQYILKKTITPSLISTSTLFTIQQQLKSFIRLFDATEQVENQIFWNEKLFLFLQVMTFFFQFVLQFFLPIEISFELKSKLIYCVICMKMISIALIIYNSQFTNGEQKNSIFETFKWYIEYYMMKDAICLICLLILANLEFQASIDYISILLVFIVIISQQSLAKDNKNFIKSFFNLHQSQHQLCFLVVQIIFYLNLIVCIWNKLLPTNDDNFPTNYHLTLFKVLSIIIMDSQFVPTNNLEILLHNILSIIGMIFQAFIFVKMFNLLKDKSPQRHLDSFFLSNKLPINLKLKIIQQLTSQKYQPKLFKYLNLQIIKEINFYQRYSILKKFFKGYSIQSIKTLIDYCEEINCVGGQIIIKENEIDDQSLYFIQEGIFSIELGEGKVITTIGQGDTFGEITFYTQQIRQNTIISQGTGKLLKLQRSKFLQVIGHTDQELFYQQKDKILFSRQLPINCFCCNSQHHLVKQCPHLTYQPQYNPKFYEQISASELEQQQRLKLKTPCSWKMDFKKIDTEFLNFVFCERWHQKFIKQTPSNQFESEMQLPSDFTLSEFEPQINCIMDLHKQGSVDQQRNIEKEHKCQILNQDQDQGPKQQSRSQITFNIIEESDDSSQFEAYSSPRKQFCQSQDKQKSQNQRKKQKQKQQKKAQFYTQQQQQYISVPSSQSFTPLSSFMKTQDIPQQSQFNFMQHITFDLDRMCSYSLYYSNGNFEQTIRQGTIQQN